MKKKYVLEKVVITKIKNANKYFCYIYKIISLTFQTKVVFFLFMREACLEQFHKVKKLNLDVTRYISDS